MINRIMLYDVIYALTARGGREAVLFGNCAPLAHEAFVRSLAGDGLKWLIRLDTKPSVEGESAVSYAASCAAIPE